MVERFDIATVHLCGQEPRGKMIAHEDGEYIRYSDYEAALRAEVPEGEPYAYEFGRSNGDGTYSVHIERQLPAKPHSDWPVRKLYTRPAPRPDMERELAEARAEMAVAKQEAAAMREQSVKNARERNALAADKARYAETLSVISKSLRGQHAPRYEMADLADAALSGASIPATADKPHKAPSEREMLHKIEGVLRTPSSGHASANELAETILDAICPGYLGALEWAVERWRDEVQHRPIQNIHRRSLDDAWRQVIRHFGGEDILLCGPAHDDLAALSGASIPNPARREGE